MNPRNMGDIKDADAIGEVGAAACGDIMKISLKIDDKTWRVVENGLQMFDFFNRKDAIFYCIALHKQQYKLAQNIRETDSLLSRLEFDAALYRIRYKKSQQADDIWGEEFYSMRYEETMAKIAKAKQEIKKNLDLAKYIKL